MHSTKLDLKNSPEWLAPCWAALKVAMHSQLPRFLVYYTVMWQTSSAHRPGDIYGYCSSIYLQQLQTVVHCKCNKNNINSSFRKLASKNCFLVKVVSSCVKRSSAPWYWFKLRQDKNTGRLSVFDVSVQHPDDWYSAKSSRTVGKSSSSDLLTC